MVDGRVCLERTLEAWNLDPDRRLYRELVMAVLLPWKYEAELVARLDRGRKILDNHPEAVYPTDPRWQRWLCLLAAWGCIGETDALNRKEIEHAAKLRAAEAAAAQPKTRFKF